MARVENGMLGTLPTILAAGMVLEFFFVARK